MLMREIRRILFIAMLIALLAGCAPWTSNQGNNNQGGDSGTLESTTLSMASKDIGTIAPYTYSGAKSTASSRAAVSGESILSYVAPGSTVFQPLVFENSSGTKVIFAETTLTDIGDGYSIAEIRSLETIKSEPRVEYVDSGEKDKDGNPIMEATTVYVDVERYYGYNTGIIDSNTGNVYLTMTPEKKDGVQIDTWRGGMTTSEYIYFAGADMNSTSGNYESALYRVKKSSMENGKMEALTVPSVFWLNNFCNASDNFVIVEEALDSGTKLHLIDLRSNTPPTPIEFGAYETDQHYIPTFNFNHSFMLHGYNVYTIGADQRDWGKLAVIRYDVSEGKLTMGDIQYYNLPTSDGGYVTRLGVDDNGGSVSSGLFALRGGDGANMDKTDCIIYVEIDGSGVHVNTMAVAYEDRYIDYYEFHDGKLYWISGLGGAQSYINTYDFSTGAKNRYQIPGKGAADYEFSIDDNGSIVYLQYMGLTEIGTYSWNPETEDYPTLLSTLKTNVHSVINIDSL